MHEWDTSSLTGSGRFGFPHDNFIGSPPDYESRRDLYNLYHLRNHLNLFGAAYLDPVRQILREYR